MDTLYRHLERGGVHVAYETPAESLLTGTDGAVSGVRGMESTGPIDVLARGGVVIAGGGFEASEALRVKPLGPHMKSPILRGTRHNTGEGLTMAMDIGAQPAGDWGDFHSAVLDARSTPFECGVTAVYIFQLGLFIDEDGQRFLDEGEDFRDQTYVKFSKSILAHKGGVSWNLFDNKPRAEDSDGWKRALRTAEEPVEAGSLDELAPVMGIDAAVLSKTVAEFNAACRPGPYDPIALDGLGTRGLTPDKTNWARPLDTPPFLAIPVTGGITFTFGGLRADPRARVIDTKGAVIPGLYVAGEAMGELFYGNYMGAPSVLRGLVFGRIAGSEAAAAAGR